MKVHKGEKGEEGKWRQKERRRAAYLMLTSQFLAERPDGSLASDSLGHCPGGHLSAQKYACTQEYTKPNVAHTIQPVVQLFRLVYGIYLKKSVCRKKG